MREWGAKIVAPISKKLACGDVGEYSPPKQLQIDT
jgi:hypothetical protein